MKLKHTPTRGVISAAKRGVTLSKEDSNVDPTALVVGRRIASGQKLSDDHVRAMAAFHSGHDFDCGSGTEDSLWGGAPGAAWSAARCAAMDAAHVAQTSTSLGDEDDVSLEVFVRDGIGEPQFFDEDDKGLIWAPILRSGTLATRPGPNGTKLKSPLVFVPGRSDDQISAVGLQDIIDAFEDRAVQHVTIPRNHENDVLDNTGYIESLRIVDSKKRPGEKVLMAAHRFTEPEVLGKVQRGSVANRSCGLLYDYVNTTTGKQYPVALEHVALTNKPWVGGMAAYGELSEEDLSDRTVVPMLLSEAPALSSDVSDGSWDGSPSRFDDGQYQRSCLIDRKNGKPVKERCSLPVREPDGTLNRAAVHAAAGMISKLGDVTSQMKRAAAKKLISLYKSKLDEPPPINLLKLASTSTKMSEQEITADLALADVMWGDEPSLNSIRSQVTSALLDFRRQGEPGGPPYYYVMDITANKALITVEYAGDDPDDAWVVPFDVDDQSKVTLSDFSQWTPVTQEWVTDEDAAADKAELGAILGNGGMPVPDSDDLSAANGTSEPRLQLSQERSNQQGGAVKPTIEETLARLDLSDEAKAVFQRLAEQNRTQAQQLSEATRAAKIEKVKSRVRELQSLSFPPGFLAKYERIALGDDGEVAAVLNLSADSSASPTEFTATAIAEALIAALPRDDSGKLALADQANLLESPLTTRPPLNTEEQSQRESEDGAKKPQTGSDLLSEWEKAAPEAVATLNRNADEKE